MRTWADVGLLVALGAAVWLLVRLLPGRAPRSIVAYAFGAAVTTAGALALGVRREHRELTARSVAVAVAGMCVVWLLAWLQRPAAPVTEPLTTPAPEPGQAAPRVQPVVEDTHVPATRRERREARRHFAFRRRRAGTRPATRAGEDFDPEPA